MVAGWRSRAAEQRDISRDVEKNHEENENAKKINENHEKKMLNKSPLFHIAS